MRLVLIGPPGSGKGTQAALLTDRHHVPTVSFGEVFSEHRERGTDLGQKASEQIAAGELVPDDIVVKMAKERLSSPDVADGFVLDGFPRTVPQAEALEEMLAASGHALDGAVNLQVPSDVVVARIAQRAQTEDRDDDDEQTVRNRLRVYDESTSPLLDYYREKGLLHEVDGDGDQQEVFSRIVSGLDGDRPD